MSAADRDRGSALEMDPERMRSLGHAVVDRVVERWAGLRQRRPRTGVSREEMERRLREPMPAAGRSADEVLERFWRDVDPFTVPTDHPRFFAFIPSSPSFASVLGDWLAAGCNYFAGTWFEAAGPTEVELVVVDWLRELIGYPDGARGLFTSGGSAANLMGLAVARERRLGTRPGDGVAYTSDQAHSAVDRAFRILGFPAERLRRLPTDGAWRLEPEAVRAAVRRDRADGLAPFCVVATAGTTNTGAVDPLPELAGVCRDEGLWLHVDGAYGAAACLTPAGRERLAGIERADSVVLDPHKWLYVGYEAGCLLVRDGKALLETFHVLPDYLRDVEARRGEVNFADYGIQLTRQARALKVWLTLQIHGREAVAAEVRRTMELAAHAETRVREDPALEVVAPASLGIVCFRYRGAGGVGGGRAAQPSSRDAGAPHPAGPREDAGVPEGGARRESEVRPSPRGEERLDRLNEAIVRRVQEEGRFVITSTRVNGRVVLRLCPLNHRTRREDVEAALEEVVRVGDALAADRPGPNERET